MDFHDLIDWHVGNDAWLDAWSGAEGWNAVLYNSISNVTVIIYEHQKSTDPYIPSAIEWDTIQTEWLELLSIGLQCIA